MLALMLLMRIVSKFCMEEVFKCSDRRMIYWDEEWTKAQAWGCPRHPWNIFDKYKSSKLGDSPGILLFFIKYFRSSLKHYVFIRSCNKCLFLERPLFQFSVLFCLFFLLNKWLDPSKVCFGETHAPFSLSRTL